MQRLSFQKEWIYDFNREQKTRSHPSFLSARPRCFSGPAAPSSAPGRRPARGTRGSSTRRRRCSRSPGGGRLLLLLLLPRPVLPPCACPVGPGTRGWSGCRRSRLFEREVSVFLFVVEEEGVSLFFSFAAGRCHRVLDNRLSLKTQRRPLNGLLTHRRARTPGPSARRESRGIWRNRRRRRGLSAATGATGEPTPPLSLSLLSPLRRRRLEAPSSLQARGRRPRLFLLLADPWEERGGGEEGQEREKKKWSDLFFSSLSLKALASCFSPPCRKK